MDIVASWKPQTATPGIIPMGKTQGRFVFINESFQNMQITLSNGYNFYLPARMSRAICVTVATGNFSWKVLSTMAIPGVDLALVEHYDPTEQFIETYPGSQVSGGGLATGNTLSNEGNAAPLEVIDIGTTGNAKLLDIFNDHFVWSVEQAGVAHQVLKGQSSGTPLQIGKVGDVTDILGNLTIPNAVYVQAYDHLGVARGILAADVTDHTIARIAGATSQFKVLNQAGTLILGTDSGGLNIVSKKIFDTSSNNLVDWTGAGLFIEGNPASNGSMSYRGNGVNTDWQMGGLSTFTGAATGTYNHNMVRFGASAAPNFIAPMCQVSGSQTMGYDTLTATQAHITSGASLSFKAWCYIQ